MPHAYNRYQYILERCNFVALLTAAACGDARHRHEKRVPYSSLSDQPESRLENVPAAAGSGSY